MTYYIGSTISIFDLPLTKDEPPTRQIFKTQDVPDIIPTVNYKNKITISDLIVLPSTKDIFNGNEDRSNFMHRDITLWHIYMEDY